MTGKHSWYIREGNECHEGGRDVLQMHHIRMLRKHSQTVDDNMATRLHPGGLATKGRRENHWRVARPGQRIGQQFYNRFCARKVRDKKISD
jgi:hypothetical protein